MTRLTAEQQARIIELQGYLEKRAQYLHYTKLPTIPTNEIVAEANLAITRRTANDPDFLNQTDSYITTYGLWRAHTANMRALCYEPDTLLDDEDTGLAGTLPAPEVDHDLSITIREALDRLDDATRTVATMLAQGYKKAEIARHMGIQRQSIVWHVTKIRHELAGVMAA